MHESRPVSDSLLARAQHEATHQSRGILKIFLGATAGVGKTYAILEAAPVRRAAGVDVVVGWVDTHGRAETAALLHGLELLPCRAVAYRGTTLDAFDLEAALARHPTLVLVDELAHTNAPGARHPKRWQDAEELLDAGISVYTTMNVQYLESLNDVVARETILDAIWEQADEVELIGLPPDDLPQRLHEGKVCAAAGRTGHPQLVPGSVSKVEMATPMGLLYKALFPSLSTFETPPGGPLRCENARQSTRSPLPP